MNNKIIDFEEKIRKGGYQRIINVAENILLRPNDTKLLMGVEKFESYVEAEEKVLEDYKDDSIYKYYYELKNSEHGFWLFKRWEKGII